MSTDDELGDVRRLLRETTERAQRAEMELELARRTAKDLVEAFAEKQLVLRGLAEEAGLVLGLAMQADGASPVARLDRFITLAGRAKDLTNV